MKITIPLDRFLLKYLPPERRVILTTGKGVCPVCGRVHSTKDEWRECALKRWRDYPSLFRQRELWPPNLRILQILNIWTAIEIKEPSPIIIPLIPEEKIEEAIWDLVLFIDKVARSMETSLTEEVKNKIKSISERYGLNPSAILREEGLGDMVGTMISWLLAKENSPLIVLYDPDSRKRTLLSRDPDLVIDQVTFRRFEEWLSEKMGLSGYVYYTSTEEVLAVDTRRKVAVIRSKLSFRDERKALHKRTRYYLVDLIWVKMLGQIPGDRAEELLRDIFSRRKAEVEEGAGDPIEA